VKSTDSRDGSGILFFLLQCIYDSRVLMGRKDIADSPRIGSGGQDAIAIHIINFIFRMLLQLISFVILK